MALASHLSFIRRDNYQPLSFLIGFILGVIPGLSALSVIVAGFLYSYFSMYYGDIPKDQIEGAKRGAIMGAVLALIEGILSIPLLMGWAHPFLGAAAFAGIIYSIILGAILGGVGGFIAFYVE